MFKIESPRNEKSCWNFDEFLVRRGKRKVDVKLNFSSLSTSFQIMRWKLQIPLTVVTQEDNLQVPVRERECRTLVECLVIFEALKVKWIFRLLT
jgi:hypothetical protein